ncbi:uncharacterized protein LOC105859058 isoform X1 [Microcebus murinus]|uniref:DPEP2 neighbor protein isoform X1 n=1 Tax=Microcebus murinus TaxID=30608 RepID=UPI003F6AFCC6
MSWYMTGKAPLPPACPPLHSYYHLLYQGCGEAQVGWHGETYCLGGGYRLFGDAPLATPAKPEAVKPAPRIPNLPPEKRRAPKRRRAVKEGEKDLGCPSPKIRRVLFGDAPLATPAKAEAEKKPVPRAPNLPPEKRRAPKRRRAVQEGEKDLGCPSPKIRRVQHRARRLARKKVARSAAPQKGQMLSSLKHLRPLLQ